MKLTIHTVDKTCATIVVGVALVASALALTLILKHQSAGNHLQGMLKERQAAVASAGTSLRELRAIRASAQTDLERVVAQIPEGQDLGKFIEQVDVIAQGNQVVLGDVQPQPAYREGTYGRIPLRLTCKGSFASLYRFLYELENLERLVRVERLNVVSQGDGKTCLAEIQASLFER